MKPKYDLHASQFIIKHQLDTGVTMGNVQRTAINNLYLRYKGILPNPNGSNLWSLLNANSKMWIHCPSSDSVASSAGFLVEFFSQTSLGSYGNFVSGDFTPTGATGGATKYFDAGVTMASFPQNSVCVGGYSRNNAGSSMYICGVSDGVSSSGLIVRNFIGTKYGFSLNEAVGAKNVSSVNSRGLAMVDRSTSTRVDLYKAGANLDNETNSSLLPLGTQNIVFHAYNNNGTVSNFITNQLAGYKLFGSTLTANQHSDLSWIEQLYQTEIITGGRQV